jgi:predicted enzyme involved in methoxymalonyl-ACP biosynthesis
LIIITIIAQKEAEIDTLLLSCRILGKNIETDFVQYIFNKLKVSGIQTLKANYIKTLKNNQVSEFYDRLGFEVENISERQKRYNLNLDSINFSIPEIYKLTEK